jgi:DNA-binding transcriptional LysR family regulator
MVGDVFETRRLRLLLELRERGTITAVAAALSYSPSTVSQQLALLSRQAGAPLLVAEGRRVRLTPHGEALAAHAERVLELEELVRGELETANPTASPVRVAVFQSAAHAILPRALTLLAERQPGLRVETVEIAPEEGLFELGARGFDLAIAEQYPGHSREHRRGLEREIIGRDQIRIAVAAGEQVRGLEDLRDRAWVMEPVGTASRQWAVQQCRAAGFEPDVQFEAADLTGHIRLIASGHAVGLLPDLVWVDAPELVRLIDLPAAPHREIFAAMRTASSARAAPRAVCDALRDAFADTTAQSPAMISDG